MPRSRTTSVNGPSRPCAITLRLDSENASSVAGPMVRCIRGHMDRRRREELLDEEARRKAAAEAAPERRRNNEIREALRRRSGGSQTRSNEAMRTGGKAALPGYRTGNTCPHGHRQAFCPNADCSFHARPKGEWFEGEWRPYVRPDPTEPGVRTDETWGGCGEGPRSRE
jgi:hypothetical protein